MASRKIALAVGFTSVLALCAANADARAVASALLDVNNLLLTGSSGSPLDASDLLATSFQDALSNSAAVTSPGTGDAHGVQSAALAAMTDAQMACVSSACAGIGENDFRRMSAPLGAYARGDSLRQGLPISGPFQVGVRAATIAEASLTLVDHSRTSSSTNSLASGFSFTPTRDLLATAIVFDASTFLQAWTASGSLPGSSADAAVSWEITLSDGDNLLLDWIPDGNVHTGTQIGLDVSSEGCSLDASASASFYRPATVGLGCSGHFAAGLTFALLTGHDYTLSVHQTSTTRVVDVVLAEPGALALFGVALAGLGFVTRRRK